MRMIFFDVETSTVDETETEKPQKFRLCTANLVNYRPGESFTVVEKSNFTRMEDFQEWVCKCMQKKKILYIFSANIWFDIRNSGLIMFFPEMGYETKLFYSKGLTTIIKMVTEDTSIVFLNMQQFIPVNVKKMGDLVGLPKLDTDVHTEDDNELMAYCRRDTDIITKAMEMWLSFLDANDLGRFCFTIASQSFTAFRHRFMHKDIYIHRRAQLTRFERKCYYGGRTEMFFQGKVRADKVYGLDINSMYPYCMRNFEVPVKFIKAKSYPSMWSMRYYLARYLCFAWVALDTPEPAYPFHNGQKLIFPTGRFKTFLPDAELRYAYKNRHIKSIAYLVLYEGGKIFQEYVDYFYEMKVAYEASDNPIFRYICKLFMNSLYGKFGQKNDALYFEELLDEPEYSQETVIESKTGKTFKDLRMGNTRKVFQEGVRDADESFVAIASQITSLARLYLWKIIRQAGLDNVYYCDTDSIFTNGEGYVNIEKLIDPSRLGYLTLEKESDDVHIFGPKDYRFGEVTRIKGIRKDAIPLSDGGFSQLQFPSYRGDMRRGLHNPYTIKVITKHLKRKYEKGIVNPDGFVTPFHLDEW